MKLIQHEIKVIRFYNQLTNHKSVKTTTFKKSRNVKAIELNLLRRLKNKAKRG